jgi:hypothetical protein
MAGQKLKIHGLGQQLKKHGWAKAENTSGDHILNHHVLKGGQRPPVNMWSPFVFSAVAQPCFISFRPKPCISSFCQAMYSKTILPFAHASHPMIHWRFPPSPPELWRCLTNDFPFCQRSTDHLGSNAFVSQRVYSFMYTCIYREREREGEGLAKLMMWHRLDWRSDPVNCDLPSQSPPRPRTST